MSAREAKKTGGFFQKLFGSGSSPKRKAKEVKKGTRKPADPPPTSLPSADLLPADLPSADLLQIETTEEAQTGQGNSQPQATARAAAKSSTQADSAMGRRSTQAVKSSTQPSTSTKSSTQPGTVAKSTIQTGAAHKGSTQVGSAVKGPTRTGPEPGRRHAPAKTGTASGSGTRPGKTASGGTRPARRPRTPGTKRCLRRRKKKPPAAVKVDTSRPLEYPTTPEMILAFHKAKPFLSKTEEWVVMSLNEYECMVDSLDVIRTMGKHSQFFEVEPEDLCEEFFEYVEDVPAYDEVINPDIWQEFRYEKYNW